MKILILNAGSSSQKSCLYEVASDSHGDGKAEQLPDKPPEPLWEASVDWTHHQGFGEIKVKTSTGEVLKEEIKGSISPQSHHPSVENTLARQKRCH